MLRTAGFFALVINVVRLESCITNMVLVCLEGYGFELFFAIFCPLRILQLGFWTGDRRQARRRGGRVVLDGAGGGGGGGRGGGGGAMEPL